MKKAAVTEKRLRELLHYDPETGIFTRIVGKGGKPSGSVSGKKTLGGYWQIKVDHISYRAHRLAWLYVYGKWPANMIDHIDGNPLNNSISNLRDVTRSVNVQNVKRARANNKLGLLGVSRNRNKFQAAIKTEDGKRHYLGTYQTPELAHEAYLSAKRKLHQGCTI